MEPILRQPSIEAACFPGLTRISMHPSVFLEFLNIFASYAIAVVPPPGPLRGGGSGPPGHGGHWPSWPQ